MDLLKGLNDMQQQAVLHTEGPLLLLAGAGSGKTKTIIHRISYIIQSGKAKPNQILALTFTNKAAKEMKDRIIKMEIPYAHEIWMSTFHSLCAKLLRYHCNLIGYDRSFVIYDSNDQKTLLKECYKELNVDDKMYNINSVLSIISDAKEKGKTAATFEKESRGDFREEKIASIYILYQNKLMNNNAMDFDDLLMNTQALFKNHREVLHHYQNKFLYLLVDEYQDTNVIQYELVSMLADKHKNICVCGDDDQSIYGFRGADIRNILEFERDFTNASIIRLERNYRSTSVIIEAANAVIEHNCDRKSKRMWTDKQSDELIELVQLSNEREEAEFICDKIRKMVDNSKYSYGDFSILYRTNAQSRVFEESFMRHGIPYQIIGGLKFYARMEIKDIISYLILLENPKDDIAFKRVINVPKRGIGSATLEKIQEFADFKGKSLFEVILELHEMVGLSKSVMYKLDEFSMIMKTLITIKDTIPLSELINKVIILSGYMDMLQENKLEKSQSRIENLQELVSSAVDFGNNSEDVSLNGFLETISLVADVDNFSRGEGQVVLMTLHNSKGLEFPVVFLPGLEEGIFPHSRSMDNDTELQEERRLCYVGITRAMEKLVMTFTNYRTLYGKLNYNLKSRFTDEIPEALIKKNLQSRTKAAISDVPDYLRDTIQKQMRGMSSFINPEKGKQESLEFKMGTKVEHEEWGIGTIININGEGSEAIASVAFPGMGIKKLAINIAPIKIIG
ncbi:MAG: DNA helicase PcrA [Eubacteriales bacterium]